MEQLVERLETEGVLKTPRVIEAFLATDRKDFVPKDLKDLSYEDRPLPIGFSQTISQPTTVAFMLELLNPQPGDKVLDVGSGSGWTTALLARLTGKEGRVFGTERIGELVSLGRRNLTLPWAEICKADRLGLPQEAPFDRILVSAAATGVPDELVCQLKPGGVMVLPVNNAVVRLRKTPEGTETESFGGFSFVPLIS